MTLFLDSAHPDDARAAAALGYVGGVTTNPSLLAQVGRPALEVIAEICEAIPVPVCYQLRQAEPEAMLAEARQVHALAPDQIVLKIPTTGAGLQVAARLRGAIPCAFTAIFAGAQAYLACQVGARYVIPYVNRTTRLAGDGLALVAELAAICRAAGGATEVMAASLKTPAEAAAAVRAGAQHLAVPLPLIREMAEHPLSALAIAEFAAAAAKLPPKA